MKKMQAFLLHLSYNMWGSKKIGWTFDEDVYNEILQEASKLGYNTLLLDVGDGVQYESHPDISVPEAWSREKVKEEIKKAEALGIKIIPKLNFSTIHDIWLGIYERMVSTDIYYKICKDLIEEIYELFEKPEYIHLGMDEEGYRMAIHNEFVSYRQFDLLWHDMRYLADCVLNTGAKPWIWADFTFAHPEEFRKHFSCDDIILSPWQYYGMYEEHFTPIDHTPEDYEYYTNGPFFKNCGFKYVEEDPLCLEYRTQAVPAMKDGFAMVPTTSSCFKCVYNHDDTVRWFKEFGVDDKVLGFINAAWVMTNKENKQEILDNMVELKKAMDKYYK